MFQTIVIEELSLYTYMKLEVQTMNTYLNLNIGVFLASCCLRDENANPSRYVEYVELVTEHLTFY